MEEYSGVLTLIKNSLNPHWVTDHRSGRASFFSVDSPWGRLDILNIYASNNWQERADLWTWLEAVPVQQGIWGGDFNMVLNSQDTTSLQSIISSQESSSWIKVANEHHLVDAWNSGQNSRGYTFHSKSHIMSWSRLDRIYFMRDSWLPARCKVQVQIQMAMSDHFPLLLELSDADAFTKKAGDHRGLMVNNSLLNVVSFQNDVKNLIKDVLEMNLSHLEAWVSICKGMQQCIRQVGKQHAQQQRVRLVNLQNKLEPLLSLVHTRHVTVQLCREIESIRGSLLEIAQREVSKSRHKCRIRELADCNDTSKAFYKKLQAKHRREGFNMLIAEDGSESTDSQHIMQETVSYFEKILNSPADTCAERQFAIDIMLAIVDTSISGSDAQRMEAPFSANEVFYALNKMGVDKTPGYCGLSKEFLICFWPELGHTVVSLINDIWTHQYMHPDLKQGVIKLLSK